MTRHTIVVALVCAAVLKMVGTADAQEESSLDGLVGGALFITDDGVAPTGEIGVNKWLTPGFGFGVRHSLQKLNGFSQLTSVTLNFRAQTAERVQLLFGWTPLISSIEEHDGWEVGVAGPLVDLFIRYDMPDQRFDIQAGVNIFAREGAWIHPMVLGVFSF